jgi:Tfp pilus assembly protein PilN
MRDKTITAVCRTVDGIEWTSLLVKQDGTEPAGQGSLPVGIEGKSIGSQLAAIELPNEISTHLKGDIAVALRTSELLMRIMEFPTIDAGEIADMVGFQVDKISPFPSDQLAISHEVLYQTENSSLVLMVAAKRSCIDGIGEVFKDKGVRIHSIDARVLGWVRLLRDAEHIAASGCEIAIIDDGIDFSLAVFNDGIPMAFRMLDAQTDSMELVDELADEIGYTLTTLDAEHDLPTPSAIQFWSCNELPGGMRTKLTEKCGLPIHYHQLSILPPLSEGIIRRTLEGGSRIELIPSEWVEHEKRKRLRKKFTLISSAIAAVWLIVLLSFYGIYKVRDIRLTRLQNQLTAIEPDARQALQNRQKLKALKLYTDRSNSSLECLREVTRLLPDGNIEFVSYNYKKGKGVTLRGTAASDDTVYNFFDALTKSSLFEQLKDQSTNTKITKGVRRAVFSVTLVLPSKEDTK